jgi:hypothetical protein
MRSDSVLDPSMRRRWLPFKAAKHLARGRMVGELGII